MARFQEAKIVDKAKMTDQAKMPQRAVIVWAP